MGEIKMDVNKGLKLEDFFVSRMTGNLPEEVVQKAQNGQMVLVYNNIQVTKAGASIYLEFYLDDMMLTRMNLPLMDGDTAHLSPMHGCIPFQVTTE